MLGHESAFKVSNSQPLFPFCIRTRTRERPACFRQPRSIVIVSSVASDTSLLVVFLLTCRLVLEARPFLGFLAPQLDSRAGVTVFLFQGFFATVATFFAFFPTHPSRHAFGLAPPRSPSFSPQGVPPRAAPSTGLPYPVFPPGPPRPWFLSHGAP